MSATRLDGKRIAILATDGVEPSELAQPQEALHRAGAATHLIAPKRGTIKGYDHDRKTTEFQVEKTLSEANPNDYDALLLPGGVMNADQLRLETAAVKFVRAILQAGKPVAAICHAPWLLIEADGVRGKSLTSYPSLKTDLKNAGASWTDREVVVDRGLVTSRTKQDIPAFNEKMLEQFAEGVHVEAGAGRGGSEQFGSNR